MVYLSVPVALRKAPPHHVGHAERFDSQQVEDHRVGESELGLEDGRFALSHTERMKSKDKTRFNRMEPSKAFVVCQLCLYFPDALFWFDHLLFSTLL